MQQWKRREHKSWPKPETENMSMQEKERERVFFSLNLMSCTVTFIRKDKDVSQDKNGHDI